MSLKFSERLIYILLSCFSLSSLLPSFLPPFLPAFLPSFPPAFLPSCLPAFPPSTSLFYFCYGKWRQFSDYISNYFLFVWENAKLLPCEPGSCNFIRKTHEKSDLPSFITVMYNWHLLEGDKQSQENFSLRREVPEVRVAWESNWRGNKCDPEKSPLNNVIGITPKKPVD